MAPSPHRTSKLVFVTMLAAIGYAADPERTLEQGINLEVVRGDLPAAIEQYRLVLSQAGTRKAAAAQAALHIGLCQEKLGQLKEAYNSYRRVATEFTDQTPIAQRARLKLAAWSGPRNLKFEEGVPGKVPPGWFVPSLPKDADYLAELRRDGCRSRTGCAVVLVPANVPRPVGNLMQSFSAAAYLGKMVRLRAWLRLESLYVAPRFGLRLPNPDDKAQLWLNVERPNHRNSFSDNMDDRPIRSPEWTQCEIVGEIDEDAQFINFGVMSIGGGRVWVDDVSFEVIPRQR